ncbi:zinc finger MYM-type protein 3-like [Actinia tenebrosa]|uniref:Zinc finger MYM-type protein 3-like n=1 Tax=Actinia tenebrosa TaxID=6105 RepID=A0A6P8HB11_ACTTE|nr:zinc finger MYM-type protein 3-like [Actinia tenebrosa]
MDDNPEFYYPEDLEDDLDLANATAVFESQNSNNNNNNNNKDEDEEMINKFLNDQKTKNTGYKSKSDMKAWQRFCQSIGESRKMEDIPESELNTLLCKFFISIRKQDGGEYEPGSITGFQRSFQRYLQEKGSLYNILKDNDFSRSRSVIAAKRKDLTCKGKCNLPNATRELRATEVNTLFEIGQFSVVEPKALQKALWWFLSLHFGWRARDESRKLSWGDVSLENDPETGAECLVWKTEKGSKTRTGQGGHRRAFNPKAHASVNKSRCPVEFYKAFRSHRSESMLMSDAPFYLAINHKRKPEDKVWYLNRPLGKNEIVKILKESTEVVLGKENQQGLKRKLTNHAVVKLSSAGSLMQMWKLTTWHN